YFKTKSTGNGFKPSYKGAVGVSATNFFIEKGETDFDGLLEKMQNGIIVTEVEGLHSGANVVSGDFSLAAEGFMVENGKITHPVEQITIAGNFYELLKTVAQVGNDLYFNSSAVGSPSLMFEDISVSGL
ncbi:MAG TPA: TldD/PmbA family protein, partial [Lachnospiraceae bacterium]|nr:TldD/PmbA family protein [Lachnospiraceae bacterium]